MAIHDIVRKLIGAVEPAGDSSVDGKRFENLKALTELVTLLASDIDEVAYHNKGREEASMKKAGQFASKYLSSDIGNEIGELSSLVVIKDILSQYNEFGKIFDEVELPPLAKEVFDVIAEILTDRDKYKKISVMARISTDDNMPDQDTEVQVWTETDTFRAIHSNLRRGWVRVEGGVLLCNITHWAYLN